MSTKVLVSTAPFGKINQLPLELLRSVDAEVVFNPLNRKLSSDELSELIPKFEVLIAGTENINSKVLSCAPNLKLISRVGIGLDGIDLQMTRQLGISVSYTPDAPAPAVAELTLGMMLTLLRHVPEASSDMKNGIWKRRFGRRIPEITIGILGVGRIGGRVLRRLAAFGSPRVLVNDVQPRNDITDALKLEWVDKEQIFREADLISIHLPLNASTKNLVGKDQLGLMKDDAILINTARGGIVNELDLVNALTDGKFSGCGVDVFEEEPYYGPLKDFDRCLLTCHMGSMSVDCRAKMEIEATEEAIRYMRGEELKSLVPSSEYLNQVVAT
jgi:D-3-phosphoglycerate dehydrogenase